MLTQWIRKGVFQPIQEMNIAMHHIANGNFDYVLHCKENSTDEMGELYKSYEDMRLKLKESTEEMKEKEEIIQQEKENVGNADQPICMWTKSGKMSGYNWPIY